MTQQNALELEILPPAAEEKSLPAKKDLSFYIQAATSDNTRKAYRNDIKHFLTWGGKLPAASNDVLHYLHSFADKLNSRTLARRLAALRNWHSYQGFSDPTKNDLIKKTLAGIQQLHGKPKEKAEAITVEILLIMVEFLLKKTGLISLRNNALLQIGFFAALRRSELVNIRVEDLKFLDEGLEILIPRSKTDQAGEGEICALPYGQGDLCPILAIKNWLEIAGITTGYVFRAIDKYGLISLHALTPGSINLIIKQIAVSTKLPYADKFSGHSLRRGFATSASKHGASMTAIMKQGRWRYIGTVTDYIAEGQRFVDNAANCLLNRNK